MKKQFLSVALAGTLAVGVCGLVGCASTEATDTEATKTVSTEQLSSLDYSFETEYAFSDFNAHSNADKSRQDGIDTFDDKDIVFEDITYDQLMDLMDQDGTFMIQLSGTWCHNSRAMSPYVNQYAKENGITHIYSYDFNLNNGDTGEFFVRMSNEKTTTGTKLNYMYGEMVSRHLANLDDWVEYPSTASSALTYTNASGEEVTVGRLQQPIVLVYNKDNTTDYSGKGNTSGECPIMYAFEVMVDRDSNGIYTKKTDDDGNPVLDENGKQVREYITDEYAAKVKGIFDFIKDNGIEIDYYDKATYISEKFNSYGETIFESGEQVNIYPVTFRQLLWLEKQPGDAVIWIGSASDEQTRAIAKEVNAQAVKNGVRVYFYDPEVDGNKTIEWGYTQSTKITDENAIVSSMWTELINAGFTNLSLTHSNSAGESELQGSLLMAYNSTALDADGFAGPVKKAVEFTYTEDSGSRWYIGAEKNTEAAQKSISSVFDAYLGTSN